MGTFFPNHTGKRKTESLFKQSADVHCLLVGLEKKGKERKGKEKKERKEE